MPSLTDAERRVIAEMPIGSWVDKFVLAGRSVGMWIFMDGLLKEGLIEERDGFLRLTAEGRRAWEGVTADA